MNLALDMMGGDYAPLEAVKGLQLYLKSTNGNATIFCIGDKQQVKNLLDEYQVPQQQLVLIHTITGYWLP